MTLSQTLRSSPEKVRGLMLLECLVYIAVLSGLLGLSVMLFNRSLNHSRRLQQNLGQISTVLKVGEAWRAQARDSTQWLAAGPEGNGWKLKSLQGEVAYLVDGEGNLWMHSPAAPPRLLIKQVKQLQGGQERRGDLNLAQFTVELRTDRARPRHRPLFSFQAVLQSNSNATGRP